MLAVQLANIAVARDLTPERLTIGILAIRLEHDEDK